ncbi:tryptophan synthase subunit alpha [Bacillus sp. HMF5848]|uniref:tryptophan synthase subunit alpha n=1 Tax=Bacillus sp. HMF5848 TaxID=2495421 RepID=UPI000F76D954|nr:tryptophan synthase subunit alpha [Bacillus sp. HMF5848]RSK29344.1 tryptophan synthase subunit alpha [Bacillus sp. HMF5848]
MTVVFKHPLPQTNSLFVPFIVAGDPCEEATIDLAIALQDVGASCLELGIPYSDPLADGPTIQRAAIRSLKQGMNIERAMTLVPKMRARGLNIPVILFTYYNPVLQLGEDYFFALMRQNDIDGVLIPDLPFEESDALRLRCQKEGIPLISLLAPTSKARVERIAKHAEGFLYCVSSLGVTGVRTTLPPDIEEFLRDVRAYSSVPIVVGFGISTKEQVNNLSSLCDGVVIGSALVNKVEELQALLIDDSLRSEGIEQFKKYVRGIIG